MAPENGLKKTFRISVDNQEMIQIEFLKGVNDVTANVQQAELIKQNFLQIFQDNQDKKFNCLVDLSPIRIGAHYPSPQARQLYADVVDHPRMAKIAVIAPNVLLRSIMRFVVSASKKRGISLFKSRAKAIDWLKK